jgi:hypothetical protein
MSDKQPRGQDESRASEETGRKGGEGDRRKVGNGDGQSGRSVSVPEGLFLWLSQMSTDAVKILLWLFYRAEVAPGQSQTPDGIAEATGFSAHFSLIVLDQLTRDRFVQEDEIGYRIAILSPEEWEPPS